MPRPNAKRRPQHNMVQPEDMAKLVGDGGQHVDASKIVRVLKTGGGARAVGKKLDRKGSAGAPVRSVRP